ncbi:MAG: DUF2089 domain-containing protein [Dehalococcoidales bacterium]|jgi:hypothetical protein|nr:DUF2089 domain-containing protein [Dehalococcoidales bacterium]
MTKEWNELTRLTNGADITVERVRLVRDNIAIEGEFELPQLARLSAEDQVFVMAFIQCHGSIKDMEAMFGISYPTVKNRLNRLGEKLKLVQQYSVPEEKPSRKEQDEVLSLLESGEISAEEAIERLNK